MPGEAASAATLSPPARSLQTLDTAAMEELATRLLVTLGRPLQLGLTAAERGEGVTTVAGNLALAFADRLRRPTVLVDLDFGGSQLAQRFGIEPAPGLAEMLTGDTAPAFAVRKVSERLSVIPAGLAGIAPAALLDDARFLQLQALLAERFDVVLYDCPPVQRFGETAIVADKIGPMLLVVAAERTRGPVAERATRDIEAAGGRIAGAILNRHRRYVPGWLYSRL